MHRTEQEEFWAGDFGTTYIDRNSSTQLVPPNIALFSQILRRTEGVSSVVELGANIGINMLALRALLPSARLEAVEINQAAYARLAALGDINAHLGSLLDFRPEQPADLSFTRAVLIHINPEALERAYATLFESSRRYIAVIEYYNPTPVEVAYRGHTGKLFKRDWAGEMLDRYPLRLVDYGFMYHRGAFAMDDFTWFLLEKH